jgi:hypothetical protein
MLFVMPEGYSVEEHFEKKDASCAPHTTLYCV